MSPVPAPRLLTSSVSVPDPDPATLVLAASAAEVIDVDFFVVVCVFSIDVDFFVVVFVLVTEALCVASTEVEVVVEELAAAAWAELPEAGAVALGAAFLAAPLPAFPFPRACAAVAPRTTRPKQMNKVRKAVVAIRLMNFTSWLFSGSPHGLSSPLRWAHHRSRHPAAKSGNEALRKPSDRAQAAGRCGGREVDAKEARSGAGVAAGCDAPHAFRSALLDPIVTTWGSCRYPPVVETFPPGGRRSPAWWAAAATAPGRLRP